jgi:hypothetical protein
MGANPWRCAATCDASGRRSFSAPAGCHHVDVPVSGTGLRRKAIQERGVAVVVKAGIQRNVAEFAELPILRGDIFANAPSDVGWPQLPLNNVQRHGADHVVSDLCWQVDLVEISTRSEAGDEIPSPVLWLMPGRRFTFSAGGFLSTGKALIAAKRCADLGPHEMDP